MEFIKTSLTYENRKPFKGTFTWKLREYETNENGQTFGYRESLISAKIVNPEVLPLNTKITIEDEKLTLESANPGNVDSYMEIGKYISPKFIKSSDMLCSLEFLEPLTDDFFKNQVMHYTGKSWTSKGLLAYQLDGNDFKILVNVEFIVDVIPYSSLEKTTRQKITKDFYIKIFVNPHYSQFLEVYKEECSEAESNLFNKQN